MVLSGCADRKVTCGLLPQRLPDAQQADSNPGGSDSRPARNLFRRVAFQSLLQQVSIPSRTAFH